MRRIRTLYDLWWSNLTGMGGNYRGRGRWMLRDDFTDTLSAGSVNGTLATPGPGTRVVTDVNSKLSLTGGVASFATGGSAIGNPGLWYGLVTREAGRFVVYEINLSNTTNNTANAGWDSNQSGALTEAIRFLASGVIQIFVNSVATLQGLTYSALTSYYCALVIRTAGMFFFIKGGTFTNWTLLWHSPSGTGDLYPVIEVQGNTASAFTDKFIRIPYAKWLPDLYAYDTFTRAALGSTELTGPDGQVTPGLAWDSTIGTWGISGNAANCSALSGGLGIATLPATSSNVIADVAVTRTAGQAGLVLRYQDQNNYLFAYHDGTNAALVKRVAGSNTNVIGPSAAAYAAGRVLRVVLDGTSAELYYNATRVGTGGTVPASIWNIHGLYTNNTNPTLDAFTLFARGSSGEYSYLDNFIIE